MRIAYRWAMLAVIGSLAVGCTADRSGSKQPASDDHTVDVVASGLRFEAPEEVPAGWTTFRFRNESPMVHFALIERLPEGTGIKDQQEQVAPVFQAGLDLLLAGNPEAAGAKFGEIPEWFGQIVFMGGPGLTAPGHTSEASVYLEPGTYLLECYMKTGGIFHSYNPDTTAYGMVHEFTVTGDISDESEPTASITMTLSGERGIEVAGDLTPGEHTVAVTFEDQKVHENFVGHDVHLARLADDTDLDALAAWMDWSRPGGLQTPAPVEFVGGLNEMPAGLTGYFKVSLEPGRYAWVSEVTNPDTKNMLRVFTVAATD